jgi:hypothetical protein
VSEVSPYDDRLLPRPSLLAGFARGALLSFVFGCSRAASDAQPVRTAPSTALPASVDDAALAVGESGADAEAPLDAAVARARSPVSIDGPHRLRLESDRPIYYAFPTESPEQPSPFRLIVNLHGTCGGPEYACGSWIHAGVELGALICPTGNAHCGSSPLSPPTWEAPSWGELVRDMDADLEKSITLVRSRHPRAIRREGAILTGYSRGGYAVPFIAGMHPGRWPLLLIIEADATLDPAALRRARVRAVALVAGEWGDQIAGMRKTSEELEAASFPTRLVVMPKTAHLLSANIEDVMREALGFLAASDTDAGASLP